MKIDTIIESYNDFKEVGTWNHINDKPSDIKGKMFARTVKVRRSDGVIALETEWITEDDIKTELEERK